MKSKFSSIAVLACAVLGGCMSYDRSVGADVGKFDSLAIEKNKTTEQEIVAALGPPATTATREDGVQMVRWNGAKTEKRLSGSKTTVRSLSAEVKNGVVVDYTMSDRSKM